MKNNKAACLRNVLRLYGLLFIILYAVPALAQDTGFEDSEEFIDLSVQETGFFSEGTEWYAPEYVSGAGSGSSAWVQEELAGNSDSVVHEAAEPSVISVEENVEPAVSSGEYIEPSDEAPAPMDETVQVPDDPAVTEDESPAGVDDASASVEEASVSADDTSVSVDDTSVTEDESAAAVDESGSEDPPYIMEDTSAQDPAASEEAADQVITSSFVESCDITVNLFDNELPENAEILTASFSDDETRSQMQDELARILYADEEPVSVLSRYSFDALRVSFRSENEDLVPKGKWGLFIRLKEDRADILADRLKAVYLIKEDTEAMPEIIRLSGQVDLTDGLNVLLTRNGTFVFVCDR